MRSILLAAVCLSTLALLFIAACDPTLGQPTMEPGTATPTISDASQTPSPVLVASATPSRTPLPTKTPSSTPSRTPTLTTVPRPTDTNTPTRTPPAGTPPTPTREIGIADTNTPQATSTPRPTATPTVSPLELMRVVTSCLFIRTAPSSTAPKAQEKCEPTNTIFAVRPGWQDVGTCRWRQIDATGEWVAQWCEGVPLMVVWP